MTWLSYYKATVFLLAIPFLLAGQCPSEITYTGDKLKLIFDFVPEPAPEYLTFNGEEYILNRAGNSKIFFTEKEVFNEDLSEITLTFNYEDDTSTCLYRDGVVEFSLPVELNEFSGSVVDNNIHLEWSTLSEKSNALFQIEYSLDGNQYTPIGFVYGAGDSETLRNYSFVDKDIYHRPLENTIYYRLKQVDFNGRISYSEVLAINIELEFEQFEIIKIKVENTFGSKIKVYYYAPYDVRKVNFILGDISGRVIEQRSVYPESGLNNFEIDIREQQSSFYFLSLDNGKEVIGEKIASVLSY